MLKRFLAYYRPHRRMLALDMLAALMISVIGMTYPIITNRMLNDFFPNRAWRAIVISGCCVSCAFCSITSCSITAT